MVWIEQGRYQQPISPLPSLIAPFCLGVEQVSLSVNELLGWNKDGVKKEDNSKVIEKGRGLASLEIN